MWTSRIIQTSKNLIVFPKNWLIHIFFFPFRAKNSTTMPNLVSLLYLLSWKQRILRYCDLDWHLNPWLMQGNVPKQSFPEKEKKTSVGLTAAIAFTKVCTCRVLDYSGFFSQVQFKEFMINPLSTYLLCCPYQAYRVCTLDRDNMAPL